MTFRRLLLDDYRLTTVEILYRLPDHPKLLQTFIWQDYDIPPEFPHLMKFLEFWSRSIDGQLYSINVAAAGRLVIPSARFVDFYGKI